MIHLPVVIDRELGWYTAVTNLDDPIDYYDHRYRVWHMLSCLRVVFMVWDADDDRVDFHIKGDYYGR